MMQWIRASSLAYTSNLYNSTAKKPTTQWKNRQTTWIDISPRKIYRWPTSTWKNAQHPLLLEKCKLKTTRYHLTPVRMAIMNKSKDNKCWRGCGENATLRHCWWECKLVQPLWRTVCRYLRKLYIEPPYDSAIPLLGIHLDKTFLAKDTCTWMFIAALFTIAKTWKQPKCPSTDDWIQKMWYIYTMEYYSAPQNTK